MIFLSRKALDSAISARLQERIIVKPPAEPQYVIACYSPELRPAYSRIEKYSDSFEHKMCREYGVYHGQVRTESAPMSLETLLSLLCEKAGLELAVTPAVPATITAKCKGRK